ncbi:MAG: DUF1926 domain-containing protein [Fibromonadaceae bacterium]|jgi:hypothetical protein|nr:DUF1926 domain-containing protein [Fibromonadaceae bacterium]
MKMAISICPVYDEHKKNAHSIAAKALATKLIGLLSGRQNLKLTTFFNGQMLQALSSDCKKEAAQLRGFIANKQLEFLGGTYNGAMLPLFPEKLQELQIQKHKEALSSFMEPTGYFCPSHAWEISIIETLEKCDFAYTLMPDVSIQETLGRKSAVSGWFAAEYSGSFIRILTYSQNLSSICQSSKRADIISSLKTIKGSSTTLCLVLNVNLDEALHNNEWLQALDTADAEGLNIEHCLLYQAVSEQQAAGKVNLISYSCFAPSCRDILLQSPQINLLHKGILSLYFRACSISDSKNQRKIFEKMIDAMQQSYFKNTPDGMQRDLVRFYASRAVLATEKVLLDYEAIGGIRFAISNFLLDGNQQLFFSNPYLECLIEPAVGGYVRTLSYKPSFSELACSMRDDGEVSPLFLDHICPFEFENIDKRNLWISDRLGALMKPYESSIKKQDDKLQVIMQSEQSISYSGKDYSFKTEKVFSLKNNDADMTVSMSITNATFNAFNGEIATELCLGYRNDERGQALKIQGKKINIKQGDNFYPGVKSISFKDRFLGIGVSIEMSKYADVLRKPILGIGASAAPDTVHGLRLVVFRKVSLKGQESETLHFRIRLNGGGFFS